MTTLADRIEALSKAEYKKWRRERLAWRQELRDGGNYVESSFVTNELAEAAALRARGM